jgi:hypothetical protein
MLILHFVANFVAGICLCNCIPHLTCGLRGEPFPTSFAKPHGVGYSSATVNFLWGSFNLLGAVALLSFFPIVVGLNLGSALLAAGFLIFGTCIARHFEQVSRNKERK